MRHIRPKFPLASRWLQASRFALAALAGLNGILAALAVRVGHRLRNGSVKVIPICWRQILNALDNFEVVQGVSINTAMNRLDLQKRIVRVKLDRHVRPRQLQIDEQRPEPAIGFDDALIALVAKAAGEMGGRANQKAPAGRRARDEAAPEHQARRILERL